MKQFQECCPVRTTATRPVMWLALLLLPLTGQTQVLEPLISEALAAHPSTQVQRALTESAQAGVDGARWQFYPTPTVAVEKAQSSGTDTSYQGSGTVSTLRLQQPLWTGGRLTAGVKKAEAGVSASQAALGETQQQLALRVVQAYGDWLGAYLKSIAYRESMQVHLRLRDQVRRRIEQGVSADSDLVLAVSRLQTVAADVSVAQAQQDIALSRLGQLLRRPVDRILLVDRIATALPIPQGLPAVLEQARQGSPTVQKAQAQALVQEATMAERRADLSPEVYLRAERQYGNFSVRNTAAQNRIFIGLSSRFGAGLSSLSGVEAARGQYEAAVAQVEVERSTVNEQVLSDYALASSSASRQEALLASLDAATQVSASYDRQFLAGRKTWLDVMNAARERSQTEVLLADLQSAQVVLTWRLAIYSRGLADVVNNK